MFFQLNILYISKFYPLPYCMSVYCIACFFLNCVCVFVLLLQYIIPIPQPLHIFLHPLLRAPSPITQGPLCSLALFPRIGGGFPLYFVAILLSRCRKSDFTSSSILIIYCALGQYLKMYNIVVTNTRHSFLWPCALKR